jgi:hypothetical protein
MVYKVFSISVLQEDTAFVEIDGPYKRGVPTSSDMRTTTISISPPAVDAPRSIAKCFMELIVRVLCKRA